MSAAILKDVEVLLFDVFGTVVDWRGTVERELRELPIPTGLRHTEVGWEADFAQEWRRGYLETTVAIAGGAPGTINVDIMHREILDWMLDTPGSRWHVLSAILDEKKRDELNRVWHRLDGWPDSTPGLYALKKHIICGALSNGNVRLLVDMSSSRRSNPYSSAARHLSLHPSRIALVAAHLWDLRGAAAVGMRTIYVPRQGEEDPGDDARTKAEGGEVVDVIVQSFEELENILRLQRAC
ncbi:hypothetical protein H0H93_016105 [Arthromyces matolae]|nr:hypothetical protein H0H93_016105 [Arthromyces matolae]